MESGLKGVAKRVSVWQDASSRGIAELRLFARSNVSDLACESHA
jgi:hypothetical protein